MNRDELIKAIYGLIERHENFGNMDEIAGELGCMSDSELKEYHEEKSDEYKD